MDILLIILGILVLIVGHEFGHFSIAKLLKIRVDEFGIGIPPRIFGKKYKETLYSINALPIGGFVKIYGEEDFKEGDKEAFFYKPFRQKAMVVLGGIFVNFILGWLFFSIAFMAGAPKRLLIADVLPDSPASKAGIKKGDIILEVSSGGNVLNEPVLDKFINLVNNSPDKKINLSLKRGDDNLNLVVEKRENHNEKEGALGVVLTETGIEKEPLLVALKDGFKEAVGFLILMIKGVFLLINNIFTNKPVLENLAGPVGIVSFASKAAAVGKIYLLQFLGLISINLVVVNLIPIPALDGGRFLIYLIEKIRGKNISVQTQNVITGLSFVLLFILMVLVTYNDIRRIF